MYVLMCCKKTVILEGVLISVLLLRRDTMTEATPIKDALNWGLHFQRFGSFSPRQEAW